MNPLIFMTDPRVPNVFETLAKLPKNSTLIYRHFGVTDKSEIAAKLRQISFANSHQLLIGKDTQLAIDCGADGVHFPQADMHMARLWAHQCPDWVLTAAVHDERSLKAAEELPLDAVTISPVFPSNSPSAGRPIGVETFTQMTQSTDMPVFALGGVDAKTAPRLLSSGATGLAGVSGVLD